MDDTDGCAFFASTMSHLPVHSVRTRVCVRLHMRVRACVRAPVYAHARIGIYTQGEHALERPMVKGGEVEHTTQRRLLSSASSSRSCALSA